MNAPLPLIALLPLAGFVVNGLAGARAGRRFVSIVGCGLPLLAFAVTVQSFLTLGAHPGVPLEETLYRWATIGDRSFDVAFHFDRLTAVMALIVTGVGSLIHVYSIGYMKDDPGYARYFAYLNLFLFFMLLLVLGRTLLVLFVGWEGVGLASYLLIGFWFDDPDKARAGKKAFITNRIGDAGFLLGMFVLYQAFGTLDMVRINAAFAGGAPAGVSANLVGILLFLGADGQVGADSAVRLAARRDGRPDAGVGADPRGDDGHRRRVPLRQDVRRLHARPGSERADRRDRRARRHSSRRRSRSCRPTSRKCSPTRPSPSSASCSPPRVSAPSAWRSSISSRTPSSRPACSSAPAASSTRSAESRTSGRWAVSPGGSR